MTPTTTTTTTTNPTKNQQIVLLQTAKAVASSDINTSTVPVRVTYCREDGLSPTHGDILSNSSMWALMICCGLPNLSFSTLH